MAKIYILIFFNCAISGISFAQQKDSDSLKTELASVYSKRGDSCKSNNNDSLAIASYLSAINIFTQLHKTKEAAELLYEIGVIYQKTDNYKSVEYHKKALAGFQQLNDSNNIAYTLTSLGVDYHFLSDYLQNLKYLQNALAIFESTANTNGKAEVFNNMGLAYTYLSDTAKSLMYFQKALNIYKQSGSKKDMADVLGNMGNVYDNMDDSVRALDCYRSALKINTTIGNKAGIANDLNNIGGVYNYYDNFSEAYRYLSKAYDFYEQSGGKLNAAIVLDGIAKLYAEAPEKVLTKAGIDSKTRYKKSIEYSKRSISLSREAGSVLNQYFAWETLSNTYQKQKRFAEALDAYKTAIILKDSSLSDKNKQKVYRLEAQYDFKKKEDSIRIENNKKHALAAATIKQEKTAKEFVLAGAILVMISSIIIFIFYKRRRDADDKKHAAEFKAQTLDTELKALRAQMNPHFIYNSLNSINDYIDKHDTKTATLYTTRFAKLMRMILENSGQKEVPISEDLKTLELYMQLEALRMNNKFTYEIKVDDDIDQENTLIPPLILQPFVENSIWHGLSKKQGEGKIFIHISKEGSMINCIVEDNGIGMHETDNNKTDSNNSKKSFGMKITKARIDIINRLKNSNATVTTPYLAEGTKIEVKLPEALLF